MSSFIAIKRSFEEIKHQETAKLAKKSKNGNLGLSSIIPPNHTCNLHARLIFKSMKRSQLHGVDYQLTNWIDQQGIEFLGQSWGQEALRFNTELQEHNIYAITDAVVSDIIEHDSKIMTAKGITLNSKTRIESVVIDDQETIANFPQMTYNYKSLQDIRSLDHTSEQHIDFIGIFYDWIEEGEIMTLITPSGKIIINVENAIAQVPHKDYIQMVGLPIDTTVSFKDMKMDGENFNCFVDTIVKINRNCRETFDLQYWVNFMLDEDNTNDESDATDESGIFLNSPNPQID